MHPRNPYRTPPDFTALATSYPDLQKHLVGNTFNFHDDAAQRSLTRALLHRDFNLSVRLPEDRLCPPVPNRLNYVLWIQDIVRAHTGLISGATARDEAGGDLERCRPDIGVRGVDVGTGASAIYPLLACSLEPGWSFVATELDPRSYEYARANVIGNGLERRVRVVKVEPVRDTYDLRSDSRGDNDGFGAPTFGFDQLFGLRVPDFVGDDGDGDNDGGVGVDVPAVVSCVGTSGAGSAETNGGVDTHASPTDRPGSANFTIEFTMCNPPFYGSAEEVRKGEAEKEGAAFGVCTGASVEMITPGGEAGFVQAMVKESFTLWKGSSSNKGTSSSILSDKHGIEHLDPPRDDVVEPGLGRRKRRRLEVVPGLNESGGHDDLTIPADMPHTSRRSGTTPPPPAAMPMPTSPESSSSRWYTSMLGKLSSVAEVVEEIRACGITNYAITEFVQGQTRRWAVGWSFGGFRLPDVTSRIENPNPTLQRLVPPRNVLRFPHLAFADEGPSTQVYRSKLDRASILHRVVTQIEGVHTCLSRGYMHYLDTGGKATDGTDDDEKLGENMPLLFVRSTGDVWSRSARRRKREPRNFNAGGDSGPTLIPASSRAGDALSPSSSDTLFPASRAPWTIPDILSSALICTIHWEEQGPEFHWVYGQDRTLFESFVSHVVKKVGMEADAVRKGRKY